jgi:hypothetical protein
VVVWEQLSPFTFWFLQSMNIEFSTYNKPFIPTCGPWERVKIDAWGPHNAEDVNVVWSEAFTAINTNKVFPDSQWSMFLPNAGVYLQVQTVLLPRRPNVKTVNF